MGASKHYKATLSDCNQAMETGKEIELVLIWVKKCDNLIYFVVALIEMAKFCGLANRVLTMFLRPFSRLSNQAN